MGMSVGQVARMFELSRTTLLYYDKIGLLQPSGRSQARYRQYSDTDIVRLRQIMLFREVGVPLQMIGELISANEPSVVAMLLNRLEVLNEQIKGIREQQAQIIGILSNTELRKNIQNLDDEVFYSILTAAGIDKDRTTDWHHRFEQASPEQHHELLKVLGLNPHVSACEDSEVAETPGTMPGINV